MNSKRWRSWLGWALPLFVIWGTFFSYRMPFTANRSVDRTLYFKLPLEGVEFHWRFDDAEALYAGRLTLQMINGDRNQEIVVFADGKLSEGWRMIGEPRRDGSVYFGFESSTRYPTSARDSLVVTLESGVDLTGRGPRREGVLEAGVWTMTGTHSFLLGGDLQPDGSGGALHGWASGAHGMLGRCVAARRDVGSRLAWA